jgi:hypothetical protein
MTARNRGLRGLAEEKDVKMPLRWGKAESIWVESVIF